jgi:hypothetical protein
MKLKLEFARNKANGGVVAYLVDVSVLKGYPSNFICVFPANLKMGSNFEKQFGESCSELALRLLREALNDPEYRCNDEVRAEIEKRIAYLTPKPLTKAKCQRCGEIFEYVKRRYQRRYCDKCQKH